MYCHETHGNTILDHYMYTVKVCLLLQRHNVVKAEKTQYIDLHKKVKHSRMCPLFLILSVKAALVRFHTILQMYCLRKNKQRGVFCEQNLFKVLWYLLRPGMLPLVIQTCRFTDLTDKKRLFAL